MFPAVLLAVVSESDLTVSSYLGGKAADDAVRGVVIQSDGYIVLAANISDATPGGGKAKLLNGAAAHWSGAVIRLSPDGLNVVSVTRLANKVLDIDIDGEDNLYVAAWDAGLLKLDSEANSLEWKKQFGGGNVWRVAAGKSGYNAVLTHGGGGRAADPDNHSPGGGHLYLHDSSGKAVCDFGGYRNTLDVAVHEPSKTVIHIGWRQARSWEGTRVYPVQIAYLRGVDFSGNVKYLGYDWSTDRESDRFLNKPENNMADTRGIRCSIGADGLLYTAYECAGGNHIFRYSPFDVTAKVAQAGGDRYHSFYNTRSEHKTYFARHNPETGEYLLGQEYCGRLSSGRGNAVRPFAVTADEQGRVYLGGTSAYGLPMSWMPPETGEYTGGAWLTVFSADMATRLFSTRIAPKSATYSVATGVVRGKQHVVFGGDTETGTELFLREPLQEKMAQAKDGFFTVFGVKGVRAAASGRRSTAGAAAPRLPPVRPARGTTPEMLVKADKMLMDKVLQMSRSGTLEQIPMPLSRTAAQVCLLAASAEGLLTFAPASGDKAMTARFQFSSLSPMDKANLAILVTTIEPDNRGAKGLAGYMLETAGMTAQADTFFEQAGGFVKSEFDKLFVAE